MKKLQKLESMARLKLFYGSHHFMKYILIIFVMTFTTFVTANDEQTVLYIGDSHSFGKLGIKLESYLSSKFSNTVMMASCGSTAKTWLGISGNEKTVCGFWKKENSVEIRQNEFKNPKLSNELARLKPGLTIVQLGTNLAVGPKPLNHAASVEAVIELIKQENSECIWIGPPDASSKVVTKDNLNLVNEMLKEITQKKGCRYIDSLEITNFPEASKEGIHYPPLLSEKWAEEIMKQLP